MSQTIISNILVVLRTPAIIWMLHFESHNLTGTTIPDLQEFVS